MDRFPTSLPRPTLSSSRLFLHNSANSPTAEMALLIRGQDSCGPPRVFMASAYACESAGKGMMTMMKQKAPEREEGENYLRA